MQCNVLCCNVKCACFLLERAWWLWFCLVYPFSSSLYCLMCTFNLRPLSCYDLFWSCSCDCSCSCCSNAVDSNVCMFSSASCFDVKSGRVKSCHACVHMGWSPIVHVKASSSWPQQHSVLSRGLPSFHIQMQVAALARRWEQFQLGSPQLILNVVRSAPCTVSGVEHQEGRKLGRKAVSWFARACLCHDVRLKFNKRFGAFRAAWGPSSEASRPILRWDCDSSQEPRQTACSDTVGAGAGSVLAYLGLFYWSELRAETNHTRAKGNHWQHQSGYGMKPEACKPNKFYFDIVQERRHQASHHDLIIFTQCNSLIPSPCSTISICQH